MITKFGSILEVFKNRQWILPVVSIFFGYMSSMSYPPFEWWWLFLISISYYYFLFESKVTLKIKILSVVIFKIAFYSSLHSNNEWYLSIASENSTALFTYFKWAAIVQYAFGATTYLVIALILWDKFLKKFSRFFFVLFLSLVLSFELFFSTSNYGDGVLLPLISSDLISGLYNYYFFSFLFLLSCFGTVSSFRERKYKAILFFLFIGVINLIFHPGTITKDKITLNIVPEKSTNLDSLTQDEITALFMSKRSDMGKEQIYLWPEALVTFSKSNEAKFDSFKESLLEKIPGTHFLGAYFIKTSEEDKSFNRYYKISSSSEEFIEKAYPVPFQEDSEYFWFIKNSSIKLSFNTVSSKIFQKMALKDQKVAVYFCNEVFDLKNIMHQFDDEVRLILIPSNPPTQFLEYYEQTIDYYSRVLAKITRRTLVKFTSQGSVSYVENGKQSKLETKNEMREVTIEY